uniref:TmcB/TmcC TPR repeats domain-containing protein n=1 Tax=Hemiselmis andersenii TaxID=464988 RepID=A0A7S1H796_HEMAN|mmetsp:Transcript_39128/g.95110  ORF Transcript_39128/g.95110 Transcript_39128/m.95110 type:complete len:1108 (+) Transcript_39128:185-3508(+)
MLLAQHVEMFKSTMFGLFYVMTEGVTWNNTVWLQRQNYLIMIVDYLQLQRVICARLYGWTQETQNVIKNCDIVYVCTTLISKVLPHYSLFILGSSLVVVSLLDTFYAAHLFKKGSIDKMWPLKVLRFLVVTMVTIAFSSVIKWLMIPTNCLVSSEFSFSEEIRGPGSPCTPFAFREILATLPELVLGIGYVSFALTTSYLSFECNPLCRQPRARYTGRVEAMFIAVKFACTLLVYLSEYITGVAVTALLFIGAVITMRAHLNVLPWHNHDVNRLRGAFLGCTCWMTLSSCLISSLEAAGVQQEVGQRQAWQWALIGMLPIAFVAGGWAVNKRRDAIFLNLDRMRGEWEAQQESNRLLAEVEKHSPSHLQRAMSNISKVSGLYGQNTEGGSVAILERGNPTTIFNSFFDPTLERKRAFVTDMDASAAARVLLYERQHSDIAFLRHVVARGIEEHPESSELKILSITFHRFVFKKPLAAADQEKAVKQRLNMQALDNQYVLYVVERKATQATMTESIGFGNVTSLHLMEWDAGIARARKAHKTALHRIKDFWRMMRKRTSRADHVTQNDLRDIIRKLDDFDAAVKVAEMEYETLMVNYASSPELCMMYADFCDHILNNFRTAEKFRASHARDPEIDDWDKANDDQRNKMEQAAEQGTNLNSVSTASEMDNVRVRAARWLDGFSSSILGEQRQAIVRLHKKVKLFLVLVVVVATTGFVLVDRWLLTERALKNIDTIDKTGLFRAYGFGVCYNLRNMLLSAASNDEARYKASQKTVETLANSLKSQHMINYEAISSDLISTYYNDALRTLWLPIAGKWDGLEENYFSYTLEFARRMKRAGETTLEEMADPNIDIGSVSPEKVNVAFINENTNYDYIPIMEETLLKYEREVENFAILANITIAVATTINTILTLLLAFFVLRTLPKNIRALQFRQLAVTFGMALPINTCQKIYRYYDKIELHMRIMEEEEEDLGGLMGGEFEPAPEEQSLNLEPFMDGQELSNTDATPKSPNLKQFANGGTDPPPPPPPTGGGRLQGSPSQPPQTNARRRRGGVSCQQAQHPPHHTCPCREFSGPHPSSAPRAVSDTPGHDTNASTLPRTSRVDTILNQFWG